ncbi:hypothetical protein [Paraburkholderia sp. MM5482-R1]|uniref:hypothetical protein n=1 Tax=unclassified Paraburkholderia TaxID=2615204 RepID=UPI003D20CB48
MEPDVRYPALNAQAGRQRTPREKVWPFRIARRQSFPGRITGKYTAADLNL